MATSVSPAGTLPTSQPASKVSLLLQSSTTKKVLGFAKLTFGVIACVFKYHYWGIPLLIAGCAIIIHERNSFSTPAFLSRFFAIFHKSAAAANEEKPPETASSTASLIVSGADSSTTTTPTSPTSPKTPTRPLTPVKNENVLPPVPSPVPSPKLSPVPSPVASPVPSPKLSPVPSPLASTTLSPQFTPEILNPPSSPAPSPTLSPVPSPVPSPTLSPVPSPVPSPTLSPVASPVLSALPSPTPPPAASPVLSPVPSPTLSLRTILSTPERPVLPPELDIAASPVTSPKRSSQNTPEIQEQQTHDEPEIIPIPQRLSLDAPGEANSLELPTIDGPAASSTDKVPGASHAPAHKPKHKRHKRSKQHFEPASSEASPQGAPAADIKLNRHGRVKHHKNNRPSPFVLPPPATTPPIEQPHVDDVPHRVLTSSRSAEDGLANGGSSEPDHLPLAIIYKKSKSRKWPSLPKILSPNKHTDKHKTNKAIADE